MPARFVIGRAGSGKTRHIFDSIVDSMRRDPLGEPIYWLLPQQATFTAERDLTCRSGLGAFCRTRVASFEQFGRDVFDDCGGSSIPQITPLGRRMIIGLLLRKHRGQLQFYSQVARQPGLAAALDAAFTELEQCGTNADELQALLDELSNVSPADNELHGLLAKLQDTNLIYDSYLRYLGQERLDQHRRLMQVESSLSSCSFLSRCHIYVDGFLDFTQTERRILVGAARAGAHIDIALLLDPDSPTVQNPHVIPDEMSLFFRTEQTYRKLYFAMLEAGMEILPALKLAGSRRFTLPGPARLERSLFYDPLRPSQESHGVELLEAPDRAAEVDAVARRIRLMLMEGMRLRDIAVLVRDLASYQSLIEASFHEHSIPYFLDKRRPAAHHPLIRFVGALLQIAQHDWPHEAVMTLLRSGLAGISLYEVDGLENYCLAHGICGAVGWECAKPWGDGKRPVATRDSDGAEETIEPAELHRRRIVELLAPLLQVLRAGDQRPVREFASALFQALEIFQVRRQLDRWMAQASAAEDLEAAAEHEQVWLNLAGVFEQMTALIGQEKMIASEFIDIVQCGLESFDLALAPPTVDQVLVGQVDRTRCPDLRAVFILGMSEGEFPRSRDSHSLLDDRDRRILRQRRIDLDRGSEQRLLDERLLAYVALTRASERVIISRAVAREGRANDPSPFWRRIVELMPDVSHAVVAPEHEADPATIATPRQLVSGVAQWVRRTPDSLREGEAPARLSSTLRLRPEGSAPKSAQPNSRTIKAAPPKTRLAGRLALPECKTRLAGRLALPEPGNAAPQEFIWPALYQALCQWPQTSDGVDRVRRQAWPALLYSNEARLSPQITPQVFPNPLIGRVAQIETFARCPFQHFARYGLGLEPVERQQLTDRELGQLCHRVLEKAVRKLLALRAAGDGQTRLEALVERLLPRIAAALDEELLLGTARSRYLVQWAGRGLLHAAAAQREFMKGGKFRPKHAGVNFGLGQTLPPLQITTPAGNQVQLSGKIDRVDRASADRACGVDQAAVIDYTFGSTRLSISRALNGLSLRLVSGLLLLQARGDHLAGRALDPTAALAVQLLRKLTPVDHPDDMPDPSTSEWQLNNKPRGVFDRRSLRLLDREISSGPCATVQAYVKKDGNFGKGGDGLETTQYRQLLRQVTAKIGELADQILSGDIAIAPYRLRTATPCSHCDYRDLCRFDPSINRYHHLGDLTLDAANAGAA